LDLQQYQGQWYEIARYENHFEKGCIGATADYTLHDDHVGVTNSCYDATGTMSAQAQGKAYAINDSQNTKLRVTFFWPFYGDYWVLMLGDDYLYSVVGDPSRKYLWILSRTPSLSDSDRQTILSTLPQFGYSSDKLYWTHPKVYSPTKTLP
jgi:apolipoprotein D and lipocalin family protein